MKETPGGDRDNQAAADDRRASKDAPLDGSTSGTIGGGGPDTGGPARRPHTADDPETKPENAAGGRLAPDPIGAAQNSGPGVQRRNG